jgi:hypothetical protein
VVCDLNIIKSCLVEDFFTEKPEIYDFQDSVYDLALANLECDDKISNIINIMAKYAHKIYLKKPKQ